MPLDFAGSIHAEAKSNILDLSRALALDLDVLIERLRECSGSLLHSPFSSLVGSVDASLIEGKLLNFKSALTAFTTNPDPMPGLDLATLAQYEGRLRRTLAMVRTARGLIEQTDLTGMYHFALGFYLAEVANHF